MNIPVLGSPTWIVHAKQKSDLNDTLLLVKLFSFFFVLDFLQKSLTDIFF